MAMIGVYQIRNTANDKLYIGSTSRSFKSRWDAHRQSLNRGDHHNPHLQAAWRKYGEAAFVFEVLEETVVEIVLEREQYYLDTLNPVYNVCRVAGSCAGIKLTEEHRRKIGDAMRGKPIPEEIKKNMRVPKNDTSNMRAPKSAEHKAKIAEAARQRWARHREENQCQV